MLTHSLATLTELPAVKRAIVVVASDRQPECATLLEQHGPWKVPLELVVGGAERQDSVAAGLARVDDESLVLVHDAARPFIQSATAQRCLDAATECGAAIVALPANDTVKWAGAEATIDRTLDRTHVWLAQTPQIFHTDLLRRALEAALRRGDSLTDDAAMVEALGASVRLVAGDPDNRKITTTADLRWAEWFARDRPR